MNLSVPLNLKYLEITGARSSKGSKIAMENLPDEIKVKIWLLRNNGIRASSTVQVMISFGYN